MYLRNENNPRRQTMKKKSAWFGVTGLLLFAALLGALSQSGEDLFQKALRLERNEGKLMEAIELYIRVVSEEGNKSLAAQAQLRVGLCYEKLGQKNIEQAQDAFQKVLDNFPGHTEAVRIAKEKLSRYARAKAVIEEGEKEFTLRKVWTGPEADGLGKISPNGRYLAYTDWNTGDLAVLELATQKKRHLTNKGSWIKSKEFALFLAWSPDSRQIAYNWWDEPNLVDMRVIGIDDAKPRTIHKVKEPDKGLALVYGWSPDGKYILGLKWEGPEEDAYITLISVTDGSEHVLKMLDLKGVRYNQIINMTFSPGGNYIVYDCPAEENSPNRDIFLLSIAEKREIPMVKHPAQDILLGWTPDGTYILFTSDRREMEDVWMIPVKEGNPVGAPELLRKGIGEIIPQGFTPDGSFYYITSNQTENVYIVALDPETGKVKSRPKSPIKHIGKSTHSPSYSPDGKYLAYVSVRGPSGNTHSVLCIRSLVTGQDREIHPEILNFWPLRWSPDGCYILTIASDKEDRSGHHHIYKIDTETGDVTTVLRCDESRLNQSINSVEWSSDGNDIFYILRDISKNLCYLLIRNLKSSEENELYRTSSREERFHMSLSPDGKWLAVVQGESKLKVLPAEGGEPQDLYSFDEGEASRPTLPAWTADGRYIIFPKMQPGGFGQQISIRRSLWRVSIEGGKPEKMGLVMSRFWFLSAHPDGQQLAFSSHGPTKPMPELWVMKNFLPKK
jgi:Tol biopolymer transport system component